jgi:hypothetical protein
MTTSCQGQKYWLHLQEVDRVIGCSGWDQHRFIDSVHLVSALHIRLNLQPSSYFTFG